MRLLFFLAVELFVIILLAKTSELFVASRAGEVFGIDALVEADHFAAAGADHLVVVAVFFVVLVLVIIFAIAAIAIVAVVVAAITAIAVVIILFKLVKEILLNCAQILVDLLDVIVEGVCALVKLVYSVAELACEIKKSGDELALSCRFVKIKAVSFGIVTGRTGAEAPSVTETPALRPVATTAFTDHEGTMG